MEWWEEVFDESYGKHFLEPFEEKANEEVDFSKKYIDIARERARKKGIDADFIQGNMKTITFKEEFDAVINMFTSFGFFERDEDNLTVLKNVSNALKSGGKFLIDVINRDWIIRHYQERDWREIKEGFLLESRRFDIARSINYAKWTVIHNDGKRVEKDITLRLYSFHELKSMLESVGLKIVDVYGGFKKEEFTFDSFHMIILSKKT